MSTPEQPKEGSISYNPAQLPPPMTGTDTYLRAVLVELRVLNAQLKSVIRAQEQATRAQEQNTKAQERSTQAVAKAVTKGTK